jgi:hypothetical protein
VVAVAGIGLLVEVVVVLVVVAAVAAAAGFPVIVAVMMVQFQQNPSDKYRSPASLVNLMMFHSPTQYKTWRDSVSSSNPTLQELWLTYQTIVHCCLTS